jgi:hypothetical protein
MFRYLMLAIFRIALVKTTVRMTHHAKPVAFSQARGS